MRTELGAGDSELLVACVGNYRQVKRHDLLIDAFAQVAPTAPASRLVLIGDGPTRPDIERQIVDRGLTHRIQVHGPMHEVRPYYPAFDIVVQSSDSEGLPNVLLEAAAAGCAIVATDAGGSAEIIIDRHTGILVPCGDVDAIATGMRIFLQDDELRDRMGSAARHHVSMNFGVERFVDEFAALYAGLLAQRIRR